MTAPSHIKVKDYLSVNYADHDGEHNPTSKIVCPPGTTIGDCPKCKRAQGCNVMKFQQPVGTRIIYKCRVCGHVWEPSVHPIDKWYGEKSW